MTPEEGKNLKPGSWVKIHLVEDDYIRLGISSERLPNNTPIEIAHILWTEERFRHTNFVGKFYDYAGVWDQLTQDNECLLLQGDI